MSTKFSLLLPGLVHCLNEFSFVLPSPARTRWGRGRTPCRGGWRWLGEDKKLLLYYLTTVTPWRACARSRAHARCLGGVAAGPGRAGRGTLQAWEGLERLGVPPKRPSYKLGRRTPHRAWEGSVWEPEGALGGPFSGTPKGVPEALEGPRRSYTRYYGWSWRTRETIESGLSALRIRYLEYFPLEYFPLEYFPLEYFPLEYFLLENI